MLTAIPMLIIANAYRRLNLWKANTGASFEWVGRAINPYLGFLAGWLMIAAYIIGTVAEVLLLGPSVLAVFVYGGWDGTLYVNEEVRHRRVNPGRAAIFAVALLGVIYTLSQVGFQGVLFSIFYVLTALAAVVYYRRRIVGNGWDFVTAGLLPLGAAGFLGWIFVKSLGEAPWEQRWSLIGIIVAGLVLMAVARFVLRSGFFSLPRESEVRSGHR